MSEAPADKSRHPEIMKHLQGIASGIFACHGVDFALAKRAGGLVLRHSTQPGADKIRREARLGSLFRLKDGYPPILEI